MSFIPSTFEDIEFTLEVAEAMGTLAKEKYCLGETASLNHSALSAELVML